MVKVQSKLKTALNLNSDVVLMELLITMLMELPVPVNNLNSDVVKMVLNIKLTKKEAIVDVNTHNMDVAQIMSPQEKLQNHPLLDVHPTVATVPTDVAQMKPEPENLKMTNVVNS